jgi:hypothetical protein
LPKTVKTRSAGSGGRTRAFSSEVDAGSREENASKQKGWSPVPIPSERNGLSPTEVGKHSRQMPDGSIIGR